MSFEYIPHATSFQGHNFEGDTEEYSFESGQILENRHFYPDVKCCKYGSSSQLVELSVPLTVWVIYPTEKRLMRKNHLLYCENSTKLNHVQTKNLLQHLEIQGHWCFVGDTPKNWFVQE
ncbi:hypothetical protein MAR_030428 [Mya arenaria]|uniref:Uncharacterized protein n=1 Tax=Mya arenaria TaxID=6604 RepID=A0ABY7F3R5_MYAAR|nr:hypothetical protein MAR_030428 [Mya arenaria]